MHRLSLPFFSMRLRYFKQSVEISASRIDPANEVKRDNDTFFKSEVYSNSQVELIPQTK